MIGKITGGASFSGALEYLTQPKERGREGQEAEHLKATAPEPDEHAPPYAEGARHRVIGGNLSGQSREEMAEEFEAIRMQRPDIAKPVHHVSLSAGENDRLTVRQWNEIAARYIDEMGFKDAPYVVIQHRDAKAHVHILTSRVDVWGKVVSEWQSKERAEKVLRGIECEYGLEQVKSSRDVERAAPKRGEIERFNRTGELSTKMSLQSHVELALRDGPTVTEFVDRLQLSGVEAIPYVQQKSGLVSGISFRQGTQLMKGSDLGRGFSWNALRERGLDYEPERDRPAVEAATGRAPLGREVNISAPEPEAPFIDLTKDADREVSQPYLLDQANPVRQIEDNVYLFQQTGRDIVDGVTTLRDLVTKRNEVEQLSKASGFDSNERDAIERLQQAAGVEPARDGDALERLGSMTGLERKDPANPAHTLDKSLQPTPELTPVLEPAEEHAIEMAIDFML